MQTKNIDNLTNPVLPWPFWHFLYIHDLDQWFSNSGPRAGSGPPSLSIRPGRLCCLFLFLIICMWQYETCLNLITFCVIKRFQTNCKWSKIRLRLHQRAFINLELPGSMSGPWTSARDFVLVMCVSRTYSPPPPPPPNTVLIHSGCTGVSSGPSEKKFENPWSRW